MSIRVRLRPVIKQNAVTRGFSPVSAEPYFGDIIDPIELGRPRIQSEQEYILEPVEVSPPDLELDDEVTQRLTKLASELDLPQEKVLRAGIALIEMALQAKKEGLKFGAVTPDKPLVSEVVGL